MIRKIISYLLYIIGISAFLLASGIKNVANWLDIARPYFIVGYLSLALAIILSNMDNIRRVTYPVVICILAWAYKHKLWKTTFSKSTYLVYKRLGKSYSKLYYSVQDAFDQYLLAIREI